MKLRRVRRYIRLNYYILLLPISVILTGVVGYHYIEDFNLLDSFYMTCITISTVGFKEVKELSAAGKLFTIALIFGGLTTVAITASRLGQDMIAFAAKNTRLRLERQIAGMKNHYILCGYGRMGRVVARQLQEAGASFVVVDNQSELVQELHNEDFTALEGDATADETLEKAGVRTARGLVSVLSKDAENVFVCLTARQLNPDLFILTRANSDDATPKLYRAGASKVINPYDSAGARIAQTLLRPVVFDFMDIFSNDKGIKISVEEMQVQTGSRLAGKTLSESDIRRQTSAIIVAIKKAQTNEMRFNPGGEEMVGAGDVLVAIAELKALNELADMARGA